MWFIKKTHTPSEKYSVFHTKGCRILETDAQSMSAIRMRLVEELIPEMIRTLDVGRLRKAAIFSITALFALPSSGNAVT